MSITTFAQFARQTDAERVFLAEIEVAEAANPENTRTLYLATSPKAFSHYYHPVLEGVSRVNRSLQTAFSGQTAMTWGTVQARREDGYKLTPDRAIDIDDLLAGKWVLQGRPITIRYGGEQLPETEFQIIFKGTCGRLKGWSATGFEFDVISIQQALKNTIINPNVVETGINVPDGNVGRTKPLALGYCKNVQPVLIDDVNYDYLFTDTAVVGYSGLGAVYDDGVAVSFTDLGTGIFRLALAPTGTITCDIAGAKFGSPAAYKDDIAGIAEGILRAFGSFGDDDIDSASIAACETALPYEIGLYLSDKTGILDALDQLMQGIPAYHTLTRTGIFRLGEFSLPSGDPDIRMTDMYVIAGTVKGSVYNKLIFTQTIQYDYNATVIDENQAAGSLTQAQKAWLSAEYRSVESRDESIRDAFPLATEGEAMPTCLINKADAEAVAAKWVALMGAFRRQYSFSVPLSLDYELHQYLMFAYPRFGLENGFASRITNITEDYTAKRVDITVLG